MVILLIFSNKNCMFFWQFTIFIYLFKNYMGSSYLSLAFPNRVQPNATHFINNLKKIHKTWYKRAVLFLSCLYKIMQFEVSLEKKKRYHKMSKINKWTISHLLNTNISALPKLLVYFLSFKFQPEAPTVLKNRRQHSELTGSPFICQRRSACIYLKEFPQNG